MKKTFLLFVSLFLLTCALDVFASQNKSFITKYDYISDSFHTKSLIYIIEEKEAIYKKWEYKKFNGDFKVAKLFLYEIYKPNNPLRQVDVFDYKNGFLTERYVYDEQGKIKNYYKLRFHENANYEYSDRGVISSLQGIDAFDPLGQLLQKYDEMSAFQYKTPALDSISVMILDSGFDLNSSVYGKMISGGVSDNTNSLFSEDLLLPQYGVPKFSHGNLVAQVATKNQTNLNLFLVADVTLDLSANIFSRAAELIHLHDIKFTNMSILYDQELVEWDGGSSRPTAIKQFVLETPDTLHVVPAGNGNLFSGIGYNIDEIREKNALIPAMLEDENVLVVGAINSNYLKYEDYPNYKMTKFSNFGEFSVDVLAPGQEFCGLKIGAVNGSSICKSGTSFASPFTLNHVVLKIHEINPDLSIAQIKEIVLKTVYVKDLYNPFPVRSGGIIHPARAGRVARYLKGKDVTVEQAVLNVRENEKNEILTEKRDSEFLSALVKFWHKRKI